MRIPEVKDVLFKVAETQEEIEQARRLHGRRYQQVGFVTELPPSGMIEDDYVPFSRYFIAVHVPTGRVVGVCRQIGYSAVLFPALTEFILHPAWRDNVLPLINLERCVEVSALAVERKLGENDLGTLENFAISGGLYRVMWQDAMRHGHLDYWFVSADAALYTAFTHMWQFAFQQIGKEDMHLGSKCVPAVLNLLEGYDYLAHRDGVNGSTLTYFRNGLEECYWPEIREQVQQVASA